MPSRYTNYWFDTAPVTSANYGVTNIPSGNALMRVEIRAVISFPSEVLTQPNTGFESHVITGLQLLEYPSSLLDLPTDIGDPGWLTVEHPLTDVIAAITWSPSTADAAFENAGYISMVWAGNLQLAEEMTLAWTTGILGGTPSGWRNYGTMQYWLA
jgi:hypothetical protein